MGRYTGVCPALWCQCLRRALRLTGRFRFVGDEPAEDHKTGQLAGRVSKEADSLQVPRPSVAAIPRRTDPVPLATMPDIRAVDRSWSPVYDDVVAPLRYRESQVMEYTKIRLPKNHSGSQAFFELARRHRVVGLREHGEIVYEVPATASELLDAMQLPYEVIARSQIAVQILPDPN